MSEITTSGQRVTIERTVDGVAHVQLSRADKRNGLDLPMFEALLAAGDALARDTSVRAVVLSGQGEAFCAGLDFKAFMSRPETGQRLLHRPRGKPANLAQQVAWTWVELEVPVIAALHGAVFGGGLQIALGADMRYATQDARLSVMEIVYGLIPDMGISRTLLACVALDRAKELVFTGRIVSGREAAEIGLVTALHDDPVAAALDTARTIASKSPRAIRAAKRLLSRAPSLTTEASLAFETALQLQLLGSAEQLEAVAARLQKRAAVFRDPT